MSALTLPYRRRLTELANLTYLVASGLVGVATFFACTTYMVLHFGWLYGLAIGWLPSLFFAAVASYLWPALGAAGVVMSLTRNS